MWLPRTKSTVRVRTTPSNFSCSSFKDIQNLCAEDSNNPQHQCPNSPKPSIFHRVRLANSLIRAWSTRPHAHDSAKLNASPSDEPNVSLPPTETASAAAAAAEEESERSIYLPGSEKRIVVYFTSLRVVRSTFEDCRAVRSILRGFCVSIDERDLSMDSKFMEELQGILGNQNEAKLSLPRVFIGGRYIGGAEEIRRLHEAGELKKFVDGSAVATDLSSASSVAEVTKSIRKREGSERARRAMRTV
ncbi:hypothetical protein U1Q18_020729 [Sarracenia purpurea var. burkii]